MQRTDSPPAPRRLTYSPGLDGLRAVACLAVMLYHAGFFHITGGFLGVTMFLTLSGFLITSLLLDELREHSQIDLRGFWRRRVFRILPLLAVVSATCALWGVLDGSELGRQTVTGAVATVFLVTNWLATRHEMSPGILNGNWSVTLEEQFYLLWPVALLVLYRRVRSERILAAIVLVLAVGAAAHRWMVADWGRAWYGTDTQVDALLLGCAVALGLRCRSAMVSVAAGVMLTALLFVARPGELVTMQLVMPAVAVCTALLIPFLQEHRTPLAWGPLAAIGRRSYGLYLWGCPIVYLARHVYGFNTVGMVGAIAVTFLVTEVFYRRVELPLRRRGRPDRTVPTDRLAEPVPLAA